MFSMFKIFFKNYMLTSSIGLFGLIIRTVIEAKPQFIKADVGSRVLVSRSLVKLAVHTGQHYYVNMSDVFFDELEIPKSAYDLGIGGG